MSQGLACVWYADGRYSFRNVRESILGNHDGRSFFESGIFEEIVPVKSFAAQG